MSRKQAGLRAVAVLVVAEFGLFAVSDNEDQWKAYNLLAGGILAPAVATGVLVRLEWWWVAVALCVLIGLVGVVVPIWIVADGAPWSEVLALMALAWIVLMLLAALAGFWSGRRWLRRASPKSRVG
ncbi:hypothetical protein [Marimonas lutisalis]|uniref:hypothetical protein n=1 Tax=Marimonas lutisalis TaxID=2545756 RepID=UPI0010F97B63|nr:hypothetical protein [Marimonas lutisalis]